MPICKTTLTITLSKSPYFLTRFEVFQASGRQASEDTCRYKLARHQITALPNFTIVGDVLYYY